MAWQLLLLEDEVSVREAFALRLRDQGYVVQTAESGEEALSLLRTFEPDVLVVDLVMPNLSGLDVLTRVKQLSPELPVIVLTARGTVKDAVEAMQLGAFDFVAKSIDMDDLLHTLRRATDFLTLQRQVQLHSGQDAARYALDRVIARSPVTQHFLAQVRELIKNDRVTVLLQGETGTGKQYMGRVIHYNSARVGKPCLEVDCPSIPQELFESELFGHEKGSFTGATGRKCGLLEVAEGPFLRRPVVVRRHRQDAVHAELRVGIDRVNDLGGVVTARAGEHERLALGLLDADLDKTTLLRRRERRGLACRPTGHEDVNPALDLPPRQAAIGGFINLAACSERRHECGANSGPCGAHCCLQIPEDLKVLGYEITTELWTPELKLRPTY